MSIDDQLMLNLNTNIITVDVWTSCEVTSAKQRRWSKNIGVTYKFLPNWDYDPMSVDHGP